MTTTVPTSNALIGIAGVHYVAAELSRRGMVALPTVRNTAAYDIIVVTPEGDKHANIQVKASSTRTSFFPMLPPEKIRAGKCDHYVLVRWLEKTKQFEAFMLKGKDAKKAVIETIEWQTENIKKGTRTVLFPAIDIGSKSPKWAKWKKGLGGLDAMSNWHRQNSR
jgi:hypothetical protein